MADEKEHPLIKWASKQPRWQQLALKLLAKFGSAHAIPEEDKKEIKKILSAEAKGETPNSTLEQLKRSKILLESWIKGFKDRRSELANGDGNASSA